MKFNLAPTNEWIRDKIANHEHFLSRISSCIRCNNGSVPEGDIQPNFYFKNQDHQIYGWISEDDEPEQLFIGVSNLDEWILAICNEN
ncbi:MAG: hypothetical protein ACXACU_09045 [Candidatus Hodarchaeales archaeon]|jgi:hypothetical protein